MYGSNSFHFDARAAIAGRGEGEVGFERGEGEYVKLAR